MACGQPGSIIKKDAKVVLRVDQMSCDCHGPPPMEIAGVSNMKPSFPVLMLDSSSGNPLILPVKLERR